jgi:hypothetical protein
MLVALFCCFNSQDAAAQYLKVKGVVYDSARNSTMSGVSVLSTSGRGTMTNANGEYELLVPEKDSIWFSYLNKPTVKYPVKNMADPLRFDLALHVKVQTLKEVVLRPRNYRQDSLQNRLDYAKVFNWQRPNFSSLTSVTGAGVGFDIQEIFRSFQFRKNRSMASFQKRLLQEERDKFIDQRFSKALVLRLTGLTGTARDSFMIAYRPSYYFVLLSAEYDFQKFIKDCYEMYKKGIPLNRRIFDMLQPEEEE